MTNSPNNPRRWLARLPFFFGGFFLLLALQEGFYQDAVKLSGVVVSKHHSQGASRVGTGTLSTNSQYGIRYHFTTPDGKDKDGTAVVLPDDWEKLNEGDPVNIEYLPATGDSRIAEQTASAPVFFLMGIVSLIGGFYLRRSSNRKTPVDSDKS